MNPYRAPPPCGDRPPPIESLTAVEVMGTALFVWLMCLLRIAADALGIARPDAESAFAWIVLVLVSAFIARERRRPPAASACSRPRPPG